MLKGNARIASTVRMMTRSSSEPATSPDAIPTTVPTSSGTTTPMKATPRSSRPPMRVRMRHRARTRPYRDGWARLGPVSGMPTKSVVEVVTNNGTRTHSATMVPNSPAPAAKVPLTRVDASRARAATAIGASEVMSVPLGRRQHGGDRRRDCPQGRWRCGDHGGSLDGRIVTLGNGIHQLGSDSRQVEDRLDDGGAADQSPYVHTHDRDGRHQTVRQHMTQRHPGRAVAAQDGGLDEVLVHDLGGHSSTPRDAPVRRGRR